MLIGGGFKPTISSVEIISLQENNTCNPTDCSFTVMEHESIYLPEKQGVLTCGGLIQDRYGNSRPLKDCIIQSKRNGLQSFPPMKMMRFGFAMTLVENQIFAIGGHGNANDSMETISTDGIEWEKEALHNFIADDPCLVVHGKSIIITVRTWK